MQYKRKRAGLLKSALLGAATLGAISLAGTGVALAGPAFTNVQFSVWTGTGDCSGSPTTCVSDQASLPAPSRAPDATFNYTGPINFDNSSGTNSNNTFENFFNSFSGTTNATTTSDFLNISGFNSPSKYTGLTSGATPFSSAIMSKPGKTTPSSLNSFMEITGTYFGPSGTVSVRHDDGASLYINGGSAFTSSNPTTAITSYSSFNISTGDSFNLVYVESNGDPSVLQVTLPGGTVVPEPGSLALLGTGLLGLGLVARRRRRKAA